MSNSQVDHSGWWADHVKAERTHGHMGTQREMVSSHCRPYAKHEISKNTNFCSVCNEISRSFVCVVILLSWARVPNHPKLPTSWQPCCTTSRPGLRPVICMHVAETSPNPQLGFCRCEPLHLGLQNRRSGIGCCDGDRFRRLSRASYQVGRRVHLGFTNPPLPPPRRLT